MSTANVRERWLLKRGSYFIHDEYAGISAFINQPDGQSDRAAQMLAVGVLVPLEHGRMGRSWRHAESLKELARYAPWTGFQETC